MTRNLRLEASIGRRIRIGSAGFFFSRFRPPCLYLQSITEPGMARALVGRGGICVHCFKSGRVRENGEIVILKVSLLRAPAERLKSLVDATR